MLRSTSSLRVWIAECGILPVGSADSPVGHGTEQGYGTLGLTTCRTLARLLGLQEMSGNRRVIGHAKEVSDYEDVVED